MIAVIRGTGSYIPPRVVENEELKNYIETNDTWIRERTGIERRHVVTDDTVASMAVEAGKAALENAGIQAESLELIIISTTSPTQMIPCNACLVQKELGAVKAACFDLNAACSGFITAYQTACAYIESGFYQKILVIGSEALSCITDWSDRNTCILFGDGAGAVVLTAEAGEKQVSVCGADGRMGDALTLYSGYSGQAIFRFAVRKVPQLIEELLQKNSLQKEDIKYYILHQANERIVEAVAKRTGQPIEKFPMNVQEYGNTSSASVPILLDELCRDGRVKAGDRLVIAGFGGGLTWAASVVTWR